MNEAVTSISSVFIDYAEMCEDEIEILKLMLEKKLHRSNIEIVEKIVNLYFLKEDYISGLYIIKENLTKWERNLLYDKIILFLESQIEKSQKITIISKEVINNYLKRIIPSKNTNNNLFAESPINTINYIKCVLKDIDNKDFTPNSSEIIGNYRF